MSIDSDDPLKGWTWTPNPRGYGPGVDDEDNSEEVSAAEPKTWRVHVCHGKTCGCSGGPAVLRAFEDAVKRHGLEDQVEIAVVGCRDRCDEAPSVNVYPGPTHYNRLTPEAVEHIAREHLMGGQPLGRWVHTGRSKAPWEGGAPQVRGNRR